MTSTHNAGVDVAAQSTSTPRSCRTSPSSLGILSVPGSILTWDTSLPGEGFAWGLPLAFAGRRPRHRAPSRARTHARWAAVTGLLLGGAMTLMIVVWTLADAL